MLTAQLNDPIANATMIEKENTPDHSISLAGHSSTLTTYNNSERENCNPTSRPGGHTHAVLALFQ